MQQLLLQLAPPPEPSLDNFVPGRNGAALQALRDIARGAAAERVVYLWGEPGSGRTHLLRGLVRAAGGAARYARGAAPGAAADHAVHALDDVQTLPPESQIAAFDLYNRVRAGTGALVACGDAAPAQLALREDLRTRLGWGLAFQLHALSDEEKAAALRVHARARAMALTDEVIAYLLRHARRDMASLIAILDALDHYSLEHKRQITLPLVREALESIRDEAG